MAASNVMGRCFGMLKLHWVIFRSLSLYPIRKHNCVIITYYLLQNLIRGDVPNPLKAKVDVVEVGTQPVEDNPITTIELSVAWSNW